MRSQLLVISFLTVLLLAGFGSAQDPARSGQSAQVVAPRTEADVLSRPINPWPLSPYLGEPPNYQNLWSSLVECHGEWKNVLVVPQGQAFILREAWLAESDSATSVIQVRVRVPGGTGDGFYLRRLSRMRDTWKTIGFRLNAGETLQVFSSGNGTFGYTGFFIEP